MICSDEAHEDEFLNTTGRFTIFAKNEDWVDFFYSEKDGVQYVDADPEWIRYFFDEYSNFWYGRSIEEVKPWATTLWLLEIEE